MRRMTGVKIRHLILLLSIFLFGLLLTSCGGARIESSSSSTDQTRGDNSSTIANGQPPASGQPITIQGQHQPPPGATIARNLEPGGSHTTSRSTTGSTVGNSTTPGADTTPSNNSTTPGADTTPLDEQASSSRTKSSDSSQSTSGTQTNPTSPASPADGSNGAQVHTALQSTPTDSATSQSVSTPQPITNPSVGDLPNLAASNSAQEPVLCSVKPESLAFKNTDTSAQPVTITNCGSSGLWTLTLSAPWLNADQTSGTLAAGASQVVQISVDMNKYAPNASSVSNSSSASNNVDATFALGSNKISVSISLDIGQPDLGASINANQLSFNAVQGEANPVPQGILLSTTLDSPVNWVAHTGDNASWLKMDSTSGVITASNSHTITVSIDTSQLQANTYSTTVTVDFSAPGFKDSTSSVAVNLTLVQPTPAPVQQPVDTPTPVPVQQPVDTPTPEPVQQPVDTPTPDPAQQQPVDTPTPDPAQQQPVDTPTPDPAQQQQPTDNSGSSSTNSTSP